jgi:hypothetical protein
MVKALRSIDNTACPNKEESKMGTFCIETRGKENRFLRASDMGNPAEHNDYVLNEKISLVSSCASIASPLVLKLANRFRHQLMMTNGQYLSGQLQETERTLDELRSDYAKGFEELRELRAAYKRQGDLLQEESDALHQERANNIFLGQALAKETSESR